MDTLIAVLLLTFYAALATTLIYLAIKKTWFFALLLGIAAILAALPVGFLAEINISGCCGGRGNGMQGIGYVVAVLMIVGGVFAIVMSHKLKKKTVQK
jgi:hypothetical protein